MGAGTCDKAGAKFGVKESTSHEVGSVEGGGGARSSGVGDRREKSGVFEGEEGIRKVGEGLTVTGETGGGEEDKEAAIVFRGGGEIEPASAMLGPRLAGEGRVKGDDKLARGMDGMGGKVVGGTMETMVGRERGVEGPRAEMVEGGSKSCHRLGGKVVWVAEKTEMRWFLAVRMARSAGRERWLWGGTY